jgi:hypothetical protein
VLVVCLTHVGQKRYRRIAQAMHSGIVACGDKAAIRELMHPPMQAHAAVMYGWKHAAALKNYGRYVYFDLGYWRRESFYRFSINGWSPQLKRGMPAGRFLSLGLDIKPWRAAGDEIIVAGSTAKACREHGMGYQEWEREAVRKLKGMGKRVVYRPKPNDLSAQPIPGAIMDRRPISEALENCWAWVTHHSNSAVDALLAGVPVHCETGVASHFSVPLESLADPELRGGREQFLYDVAWLQWTLEEMRSGEAWKHIRSTL